MRTVELLKLMPTQFRQTTDNPLVAGHYIPKLGEWTQANGYKKRVSLNYSGEALACPIIAVVQEKMGGENLELTITAKTATYDSLHQKQQGNYVIKRKKYIPTETTVQTVLTIPKHTRPWATFLLTGLGKNVYEITSISDNAVAEAGKIEFYALASNGSRIVYWLGLHKMAEMLREILNAIWIAPTKCIRCGATGIEPETESDICLQCKGYKYSGHNATRWIQRMKGFDVGLAREVLDWDNLTEADYEIIRKFINKCWTQKWWVTPTEKEIKRLFAHFYMVEESKILITKRYNLQEPVWHLSLPYDAETFSPFGTLTVSDRDLLRFIAESLTPAGVNVFVGFYFIGNFGNLEDFSSSKPVKRFGDIDSFVFGEEGVPWGMPRWKDWNGWVDAIDNFEGGLNPMWSCSSVSVQKTNDQSRHWAKFENNAYMEIDISGVPTGQAEMWIHPQDTVMRVGIYSQGSWDGYIDFDNDGFYDNDGTLIRIGKPDNDYHLRIAFIVDLECPPDSGDFGKATGYIDREQMGTGFCFIQNVGANPKFRIESIGSGNGYIDAYGDNWTQGATGYQIGDNWQRLYPAGYGVNNWDYATGQSGTVMETDLFEKYINRDQFWDVYEP